MAGDINQVILVGRVTRDAELKYAASGAAICRFAIAVNRRVKKGEQWQDEASFFNLTLFDKQAENLNKYLVKGTQVAIQGELRQNRWEKDGEKHSETQVWVQNIQLLGGGRGEGSGAHETAREYESGASRRPAQAPAADTFDAKMYEDSIPF